MTLAIIFGDDLSSNDLKDIGFEYDLRSQMDYIVVTDPKNGPEDVHDINADNSMYKLWPFLRTLHPYVMSNSSDIKYCQFRGDYKFIIIVWH